MGALLEWRILRENEPKNISSCSYCSVLFDICPSPAVEEAGILGDIIAPCGQAKQQQECPEKAHIFK